MEANDLTKLTLTELEQKAGILKKLLGISITIMIILLVSASILFIERKSTVAISTLVIFFSLMTLLFTNKKQLSELTAEIRKRKT